MHSAQKMQNARATESAKKVNVSHLLKASQRKAPLQKVAGVQRMLIARAIGFAKRACVYLQNPNRSQHPLQPLLSQLKRSLQNQSLRQLGQAAVAQGDYATARDYYEEALALAREIGHRPDEGLLLTALGEVVRRQGAYGRAHSALQQSLVLEVPHKLAAALCLPQPHGVVELVDERSLGLFPHVGTVGAVP